MYRNHVLCNRYRNLLTNNKFYLRPRCSTRATTWVSCSIKYCTRKFLRFHASCFYWRLNWFIVYFIVLNLIGINTLLWVSECLCVLSLKYISLQLSIFRTAILVTYFEQIYVVPVYAKLFFRSNLRIRWIFNPTLEKPLEKRDKDPMNAVRNFQPRTREGPTYV